MAVCNSTTKSCLENQLFSCLQIIRKYEWLHSTLLHDFFVEKHWESIPIGWRSSLKFFSPTDLSNFLNYWDNNERTDLRKGIVLPLELLALKFCVSEFSIKRTPVKNANDALKFIDSPDKKSKIETGKDKLM